MIKSISAFLLLFAYSFSGYAADACSSSSFCVYASMPIWNQGSTSLREFINEEKNLEVKSDPGWCGMVSSAMFLRGIARERASTADMPNTWDADKIVTNRYIVDAGDLVGTNFKAGGTFSNQAVNGFQKVRNSSQYAKKMVLGLISITQRGYFYNESDGDISSSQIKTNIRINKPAHYIGVGIYKTKTALDPKLSCTWKWAGIFPYHSCVTTYVKRVFYERDGGHALVINGYDGSNFKIYDPWGRIYNVNMATESVDINGNKRSKLNFKHVNGENGFAYSYGSSKLLLDSLVGWSLLRN